jgi:hypothetical protein
VFIGVAMGRFGIRVDLRARVRFFGISHQS